MRFLPDFNTSETREFTALLATSFDEYRPTMINNIKDAHPFWWWLDKKGMKEHVDGGNEIKQTVVYGRNKSAMFYKDDDVINIEKVAGATITRWQWANVVDACLVHRTELRKNSGKHQWHDLVKMKLEQLEEGFRRSFSDLLHGVHGSGFHGDQGLTLSDDPLGYAQTRDSVGGANYNASDDRMNLNSLDHLVPMFWGYADPSETSTTEHHCGGIKVKVAITQGSDESYHNIKDITIDGDGSHTNSWWLPYTLPGFQTRTRSGFGPKTTAADNNLAGLCLSAGATAGQALNLVYALQSMYTRLSEGSEHPDLGLCGEEAYNAYFNAGVPFERISTKEMLLDLGFENITFRGMTILLDKSIRTPLKAAKPTAIAPATPFYLLNSKHLRLIVDTKTDFVRDDWMSGWNQLVKACKVLWTGQLICKDRRFQGVISLSNVAAAHANA